MLCAGPTFEQATEIASRLGALWKELSDKDKVKYTKQAEVSDVISLECCFCAEHWLSKAKPSCTCLTACEVLA